MMTVIVTSKPLMPHLGKDRPRLFGQLPPGVAYRICTWDGHRDVTWAEVGAERRARQARILECRRRHAVWRFAFVDVRYYDQFIFGGWQAELRTAYGEYHWIDRDRPHLKQELLRMFPLTLFGDWEAWKVAFARRHQRGRFCRRPRGRALVRWDGQKLRPVSARRVGA